MQQTDIDGQIEVAKDLIRKREEIDEQLSELFGGGMPGKRQRVCTKCGKAGHLAKTCSAAPASDFALSNGADHERAA